MSRPSRQLHEPHTPAQLVNSSPKNRWAVIDTTLNSPETEWPSAQTWWIKTQLSHWYTAVAGKTSENSFRDSSYLQFTVRLRDLLSTKQIPEGLSSKEHYLLLSHLDTLHSFHRVRPRMKQRKTAYYRCCACRDCDWKSSPSRITQYHSWDTPSFCETLSRHGQCHYYRRTPRWVQSFTSVGCRIR